MSLDLKNNLVMPVDVTSTSLTPDTFDLRPRATFDCNVGFETTGRKFDVLRFDRCSRPSLRCHAIAQEA